MRLIRLPRRAVVGVVLSAGLVGAGVAAFADPAATATCKPTYTDPAGDAGLGDPATAPATGDDDLDLVGITHSVDAGSFTTSFKVVELYADGPSFAAGDRFVASFTVAKKAVTVTAERDFSGVGVTKGSATVGGTAVTFPVKVVEDVPGKTISAVMAAADLEKAAGTPLSGQPFSAMSAVSRAIYPSNAGPNSGALWDSATAPATAAYTFGSSCSGGAAPAPAGSSPAPSSSASPGSDTATATITISAPARIHTSDPEPTLVTLKDGNGQPQSGKRITAQVGSGKAVAGTTNSSGQVRLSPIVIDRAGTRALVVRYAGDASGAGKAEKRQNVTVLAEVSKIATRSSGTGSTRAFTITLTDDDATRHPYGGAKLTVGYSGKSVTVTTDRNGRATLQLRAGTHVDIRYAGKPGYVAVGTARTVV